MRVQTRSHTNNQIQPAEAAGLIATLIVFVLLLGAILTAMYFFGVKMVAIFFVGSVAGIWLCRRIGK